MPAKGIKIERICQVCGKSRLFTPSQVKLPFTRQFCSMTCKAASQRITVDQALANYIVDESGCWIYQGKIDTNGYAVLGQRLGKSKYVNVRLGRAVLARKLGTAFDDPTVFACHTCDKPACIRPDHLFAGDAAVNKTDSVQKRRHGFGERNGRAVLSESDVRAIRALRSDGVGPAETVRRLGFPIHMIERVLYGETWKHVT